MDTKKLIGSVTWQDPEEAESAEIERALLRNGGQTLVMDFVYDGLRYSLEMQRSSGNRFSGTCELATKKERWTVRASGRLYSYGSDHVLIGSWQEYDAYQWLVELEEVDTFPDESPKV